MNVKFLIQAAVTGAGAPVGVPGGTGYSFQLGVSQMKGFTGEVSATVKIEGSLDGETWHEVCPAKTLVKAENTSYTAELWEDLSDRPWNGFRANITAITGGTAEQRLIQVSFATP